MGRVRSSGRPLRDGSVSLHDGAEQNPGARRARAAPDLGCHRAGVARARRPPDARRRSPAESHVAFRVARRARNTVAAQTTRPSGQSKSQPAADNDVRCLDALRVELVQLRGLPMPRADIVSTATPRQDGVLRQLSSTDRWPSGLRWPNVGHQKAVRPARVACVHSQRSPRLLDSCFRRKSHEALRS